MLSGICPVVLYRPFQPPFPTPICDLLKAMAGTEMMTTNGNDMSKQGTEERA
tara:strand:- start:966 stop:1121 length:156 start_codon:yes stop_codon:yes gene_type:complete